MGRTFIVKLVLQKCYILNINVKSYHYPHININLSHLFMSSISYFCNHVNLIHIRKGLTATLILLKIEMLQSNKQELKWCKKVSRFCSVPCFLYLVISYGF